VFPADHEGIGRVVELRLQRPDVLVDLRVIDDVAITSASVV
jgi:hypothetical protein